MSHPTATPVAIASRSAESDVVVVGRRLLRAARSNLPLVALGVLVFIAIAGSLLAPYNPLDTHAGRPLEPPSWTHLFGTDQAGRDVFSRVLVGTRLSLTIGVSCAGLAVLIGGLLGIVAAMSATWIDETIMRMLDILLAFPGILLAVVLATALRTGTLSTIIVLTVIYTPALARFVRALMLGQLGEDYVLAARLLGTRRIRLVGYQIGVNLAIPVLVFATTVAAEAIVIDAALSYIGLGTQPPAPSWGNIIFDGSSLLYSGQWWVSGFGGLAVVLAVLTLNSSANLLNRRLDAGVEQR
jgi:ABC-type dipeptide/oligopeptide/nickel transport system permease subunit